MSIDSNYVSGFVDGEGSFLVFFSPRSKLKTGIEVRPSFSVSQRTDRSEVLWSIKGLFGCGQIRYSKKDNTYKYEVRSLEDLNGKIIPHFNKFPLLSSKQKEVETFSVICSKVLNKEHLKAEGLKEIIEMSFSLNSGGSRRYSKEYILSKLKI